MNQQKKDPIGISLILLLFILLGIIGVIYYKSIDWDVLKRLENTSLILPTPTTSITNNATSSSTPTIIKK